MQTQLSQVDFSQCQEPHSFFLTYFFILRQARKGLGFGHQQLHDAISHDGLQDAFNKMPMGNCA
jgi:hypothetical protein